jgi:hypothetical protein
VIFLQSLDTNGQQTGDIRFNFDLLVTLREILNDFNILCEPSRTFNHPSITITFGIADFVEKHDFAFFSTAGDANPLTLNSIRFRTEFAECTAVLDGITFHFQDCYHPHDYKSSRESKTLSRRENYLTFISYE